ncbi:hypothetical protein ACQSSU_20430 [Micromonospora echinospora]
MPYPPSAAAVTVTAAYLMADGQGGTPATGRVAFQLRSTVQLPADDAMLIPTRVEAELVDGRLSVQLPSPAGDDVSPTGVTWWVVERITGVAPRTYDVILPAGPATVDLADLAPAEPSRGAVSYVLAAQVGQPGGVAPLGPDGLVPAVHLPAGGGPGGPGAVTSVDGRTGAVTLTDRYLPLSARGQAGGVAALDGGGRIPTGQLPALTADQVGAAPAVHQHDDRYYTESEVDVALAGRSPVGHHHDGRYPTSTEVAEALAGKAEDDHSHPDLLPAAAVGTEGGPAGPLVGGVLPTAQLPALAITDVHPVASQAAMLALPAQRGDVAIRSDLPAAFILAAEPASVLENWAQLPTPADAVLSVNGRAGVVVLGAADVGAAPTDHSHTPGQVGAAPATHQHAAGDITSGTVAAARLPDATSGSRGVVQLAGDLAGTAAAPTVPGLAARVPTSRTVTAGTGLTGGGDLTADRTLAVAFGTTAGTAAQGNDARLSNARTPTAHAASHAPGGSDDLSGTYLTVTAFGTQAVLLNAVHTVDPGAGQALRTIRLNYPVGAGSADLERVYVGSGATSPASWRNEWGAGRFTPPLATYKDDAALRAVQRGDLTAGHTGGYVELENAARTQVLHKRDWHGRLWRGDGTAAPVQMADLLVLDPGDPVPDVTPAGTVIVRRTA